MVCRIGQRYRGEFRGYVINERYYYNSTKGLANGIHITKWFYKPKKVSWVNDGEIVDIVFSYIENEKIIKYYCYNL